jgi:4-hydroxy-tetrahydrodipicolinate synthase
MEFKGVYTALITPFKNGAVDYDALTALVEKQIAGKVAGVVPVGTTGESPTVSPEEHLKIIEAVVKSAAGRCQVVAGTGANSTEEAVYLTNEAKAIGADATLQVLLIIISPLRKAFTGTSQLWRTNASCRWCFTTFPAAAECPSMLRPLPAL